MIKSLHPTNKIIKTEVNLSGSKSISNRVLLMAAFANGTSVLKNILISDDIESCFDALDNIGIKYIIDSKNNKVTIYGCSGNVPNKKSIIYTRDAGTVTRFLIPMLSAQLEGLYTFSASKRMMERPISDLLLALEKQGIHFDYETNKHKMPFTIHSSLLKGGKINIDGKKSSQFFTGLLMCSVFSKNTIEINSSATHYQPYIEMTKKLMQKFSVDIIENNNTIIKANQSYKSCNLIVEPDASTASYFWALSALLGAEITVNNLSKDSIQGDIKFLKVLEMMGCEIHHLSNNTGIKVTNYHNKILAVNVNMRDFSDTFMTVVILAVFADMPSLLTGLTHTRGQECDRILAMETELKKIGVKVETTIDSIKIYPCSNLNAAILDGNNDHRIAMSLSLLGLKKEGIKIKGANCVKKTCPDYFERMEKILY